MTPVCHPGLWGNRLQLTAPGLRGGPEPGAFPGSATKSWANFSLGAWTTRGSSQRGLHACLCVGQREKPVPEEERRESHRACLSMGLSCKHTPGLRPPDTSTFTPLCCFLVCLGLLSHGGPGPTDLQLGDLQEHVVQLHQGPLGNNTEDKMSCCYGQHILFSLLKVGILILVTKPALSLPSLKVTDMLAHRTALHSLPG